MKGLPRQPSFEDLSAEIKEYMKELDCGFIYVASDEKRIVAYLNEHFPGKVIINNRIYYDEVKVEENIKSEATYIANRIVRNDNEYLIGAEYLSSVNLSAHCKVLIAGNCGASKAVLYMNNRNYKKIHIFDCGKY